MRQVQEKLLEAGNPALRGKLQNLLAEAAKGVGQNPSATPGQILEFCRGVLEDAVAEQGRQALAVKQAGLLGTPEASAPAAGDQATRALQASDSSVGMRMRSADE